MGWGWCSPHYQRWKKYGDPKGSVKRKTLKDRFENGFLKQNDGCWVWIRHRDNWGYGQIWARNTMIRTHRISWILYRGEIPSNKLVLHHCDNPPCVNPDHLYIGTNQDNTNDKLLRGREAKVRGEKNGNSKLTENDVIKIREWLDCGESDVSISQMFCVNRSLIRYIRIGKSWAWLK